MISGQHAVLLGLTKPPCLSPLDGLPGLQVVYLCSSPQLVCTWGSKSRFPPGPALMNLLCRNRDSFLLSLSALPPPRGMSAVMSSRKPSLNSFVKPPPSQIHIETAKDDF